MKRFYCLTILLALSLFGSFLRADTLKEKPNPKMEEMMKLTTPGQEHKILKGLVGNWKVDANFWMEPTGKPEHSTATQKNTLIMDGRFLQTEYHGKTMGKPFRGMGLLGFDRVRNEYQSVWIDTITTGIATSAGQYDAGKKLLTESGTSSCPMSGDKDKPFRAEWHFTDKNSYRYTMFTKDAQGKEFKSLELLYKRG